VLRRRLQTSILKAISALPHGVQKMSADLPGLVESSANVAVVATTSKQVTIETSQRSSVASELRELQENVRAVFELAGASVKQTNGYPGWKPNLESPVLGLARRTYREQFGTEPAVKAIHAGLECGIIGQRCPGMDMVSFGPTLSGVHSPDERIEIASVEKFWRYLLALLRAID
jgi:dipeptidase D